MEKVGGLDSALSLFPRSQERVWFPPEGIRPSLHGTVRLPCPVRLQAPRPASLSAVLGSDRLGHRPCSWLCQNVTGCYGQRAPEGRVFASCHCAASQPGWQRVNPPEPVHALEVPALSSSKTLPFGGGSREKASVGRAPFTLWHFSYLPCNLAYGRPVPRGA